MASPYLDLLRTTAPEAIVVATGLATLTIGLTTGGATGAGISTGQTVRVAKRPASPDSSLFVAIAGVVVAIFVIAHGPTRVALFNGMIVVSPLTSLFKTICLALTGFALLLTPAERSLRNLAEYRALMLFAALGLMLLIGSEELLTIFIGLELLGLSLYVLTAFDKSDVRSAEAGLKYFLFGSTASAFTLFGISLIYGITGSTALSSLASMLPESPASSPLLAVGLIMTLIGFAFKIAAAPFHLWAPDAYQGAPIASAAFIASGSKVASFVVLGKIVLVGFAPVHGSADWHAMTAGWSPVLAVIAALSILLGNFVALVQKNVRRLLAYSAVAHSGYTLLGIVAGGPEGFSAALFYTTIYAFTLVGAFAVCGIVRQRTGGDDLENFAGLWSQRPGNKTVTIACMAMAVFMLSLAGLPPLPGFFGKFYLFSAALAAGSAHGLLWLVSLALFGSLVSLYYYLAILRAIFIDRPAAGVSPESAPSSSNLCSAVVIAVLAVAILFVGIMPSELVQRILISLA